MYEKHDSKNNGYFYCHSHYDILPRLNRFWVPSKMGALDYVKW